MRLLGLSCLNLLRESLPVPGWCGRCLPSLMKATAAWAKYGMPPGTCGGRGSPLAGSRVLPTGRHVRWPRSPDPCLRSG